jgi:1-acyl-sn-glycerol-3-phosphate acyltransferase
MMRCLNEGGSLLIFPEGNRSYAEFQFTLTDGFSRFIKFFKKPVVLFNFHGGTGVDPRFANKRRKGPFYGEIKRILKYEEYKDWSDEELYRVVSENLKVYDSDSGEKYKSKARAEYLERMLFVCPKCGKVETLVSDGNYLYCKNCGLKVEYTEDLHLRSDDKDFKFKRLIDWYNFQIEFVRDCKILEGEILHENKAKLFVSHRGERRKLIAKGPVILTENYLKFSGKTIDIADIEIASPINGTNFNFSTGDEEYLVMGSERFNPLKYVLFFNKLNTKMKVNHADVYYNLDVRK